MANMNLYIGEGILCTEPKTRYTKDEKAVCNFILKIENSYKSKKNKTNDIQYKKRQAYIPIVAWDNKAKLIEKEYQKGDKIRIMGRITTEVNSFEVVLDDICLIKGYLA
jgi:single-stranded DNA-binding protein